MLCKSFEVGCRQRRLPHALGTLAAALSIAALSGAAHAGTTNVPGNATPGCAVSAAKLASWFESGAVTPNGAVKPADSLNFPDTPNCDFYDWSQQMFLWLTSPAPTTYGGGSRVFDSPDFFDVSLANLTTGKRTFIPHNRRFVRAFGARLPQAGPNGVPVILNKAGKMFEVNVPRRGPKGRPLILDQAGKSVEVGSLTIKDNKAVFMDKSGKAIPPNLSKLASNAITARRIRPVAELPIAHRFIGPAGLPIFVDIAGNVLDVEEGQATGDVLMAQNGSLVYYVMETNDVFTFFLTGAKHGAITPAPTRFPTTAADLAKITDFATAHGRSIPNDANALAVVLKTSWVEATGLDTSKYVTMRAMIPTYDKTNPDHWVPNGQKRATLALVGMHVVGSTKGHPEMIWATFEHVNNTPNAPYSYNSGTPSPTSVPQDSGAWLFSANGAATPFNSSRIAFNAATFGLDAIAPQHIGPSNTLRTKPWGMLGDAAASNAEIISSNHSVLSQLAAGDLRKNYIMIGATWTPFGSVPTGGNSVGTNHLSNSTMETYTQGAPGSTAGMNCFSCHVASVSGNPPVVQNNSMLGTPTGGGLSHIWGPLQPLF